MAVLLDESRYLQRSNEDWHCGNHHKPDAWQIAQEV